MEEVASFVVALATLSLDSSSVPLGETFPLLGVHSSWGKGQREWEYVLVRLIIANKDFADNGTKKDMS